MIKIIFAVDCEGNFGNFDGSLPWPHLSGDMKFFKSFTEGSVVLMGSGTWAGLPVKFPNRRSVVLSTKYSYELTKSFKLPNGKIMTATPDQIMHGCVGDAINELQAQNPHKDIIVIGGKKVILDAMGYADEVSMTVVSGIYPADINLGEPSDLTSILCETYDFHITHADRTFDPKSGVAYTRFLFQ